MMAGCGHSQTDSASTAGTPSNIIDQQKKSMVLRQQVLQSQPRPGSAVRSQ